MRVININVTIVQLVSYCQPHPLSVLFHILKKNIFIYQLYSLSLFVVTIRNKSPLEFSGVMVTLQQSTFTKRKKKPEVVHCRSSHMNVKHFIKLLQPVYRNDKKTFFLPMSVIIFFLCFIFLTCSYLLLIFRFSFSTCRHGVSICSLI